MVLLHKRADGAWLRSPLPWPRSGGAPRRSHRRAPKIPSAPVGHRRRRPQNPGGPAGERCNSELGSAHSEGASTQSSEALQSGNPGLTEATRSGDRKHSIGRSTSHPG
eukprot:7523718-Alexandrium_andersonii.AAC.1